MERARLIEKRFDVKKMLTLTKVAKIFRRSRIVILGWVHRDGLPADRVAGAYWFEPEAVVAWAKEHNKRLHLHDAIRGRPTVHPGLEPVKASTGDGKTP